MFTNINANPDYQNLKTGHKNTLKSRSYFIPTSGLSESMKIDNGEQSERYQLLSGEDWGFRYYKAPSLIEEEIIIGGAESDASEKKDIANKSLVWNKIAVPSCWQNYGYEEPFYVNNDFTCPAVPPLVPNFNPCGVYKKTFEVSAKNKGKIAVLNFLGVCSGFNVFLNGEEVGYSQTSHNSSQFDITRFLKSGKNLLVVIVYKWTDGLYLESQDMFRYNGIFRDVYLTFNEPYSIFDLRFTYTKQDTYFVCKLEVEHSEDCFFKGILQYKSQTVLNFEGKGEAQFILDNPYLWSAEQPNLYSMHVSLFHDGIEYECVKETVGFKTVEIISRQLLINSRPIKIKGVNHHDTDCQKGYVMSAEDYRRDFTLMKEYNCNTVRFAHYPPHPQALKICDELGLYVIDEADIESYGALNMYNNKDYFGCSDDFSKSFLDRVERLYERDKNRAGIIMWSLGNEAGVGKNFDLCYNYLKSKTQIPVQYETPFRECWYPNENGYDVISTMYTDYEGCKQLAERTDDDRPFYLCEYSHAMGVSMGGLKEYWELIYKYDSFIGGCVWEFCDHAVYREGSAHKYTYGGDHGEYVHDSNFCCDGLFTPLREPKSAAKELLAAYRPLIIKDFKAEGMLSAQAGQGAVAGQSAQAGQGAVAGQSAQAGQGAVAVQSAQAGQGAQAGQSTVAGQGAVISFKLYNTNSFTNSSKYKVIVKICESGKVMQERILNCEIQPLTSKEFSIQLEFAPHDSYMQILTYDGERLCGMEENLIKLELPIFYVSNDVNINYTENKNEIIISKGDLALKFCKLTCTISSYTVGGKQVINQAPVNGGYTHYSGAVAGILPNIWRAPTDNDMNIKKQWHEHMYDKMWLSFYTMDIVKNEERGNAGSEIKIVAGGIFSPPKLGLKFKIKQTYIVYSDLSVKYESEITPQESYLPYLPRFGAMLEMPKEYSNIKYYGYGGGENYPDMKMAALSGIYTCTASDMHETYIRPQENGSRTGTRYFEVTDGNGDGLRFIACDNLLNFSVKTYSLNALTKANHIEDLKESDSVTVFVDGHMSGIGTNSCGPSLDDKYRVEALRHKGIKTSFLIKPLTKNNKTNKNKEEE